MSTALSRLTGSAFEFIIFIEVWTLSNNAFFIYSWQSTQPNWSHYVTGTYLPKPAACLRLATNIEYFSTVVSCIFSHVFSVTDKETLVTSLQQEVQQLKEVNQSQDKSYVSTEDSCGCAH